MRMNSIFLAEILLSFFSGLWVFLDLKLFPGDAKSSAWASFVSSSISIVVLNISNFDIFPFRLSDI